MSAIEILGFSRREPAPPRVERPAPDCDARDWARSIAGSKEALAYHLHRSVTQGGLIAGFSVPIAGLRLMGSWRHVHRPGPRFGYEGVSIPRSGADPDQVTIWPHTDEPTWRGRQVWGAVQLSGPLRPQLNVARDRVRALPLSVHLHVQAALWRAAELYSGTPFERTARSVRDMELFTVPPAGPLRMDTLLQDGSVWDFWREALIADLPRLLNQSGIAGLGRLHWRGSDRSDTRFRLPPLWSNEDIHRVIADVLIQLHLPIGFSRFGLRLRMGGRPEFPEGLRRFPPLWFVPYEGSPEVFQDAWQAPVNLRHPLGAWWGENAGRVEDESPHYFRRLVRLLAPYRTNAGTDRAPQLNALFDDVARALPDLHLPDVRLTSPGPGVPLRSR